MDEKSVTLWILTDKIKRRCHTVSEINCYLRNGTPEKISDFWSCYDNRFTRADHIYLELFQRRSRQIPCFNFLQNIKMFRRTHGTFKYQITLFWLSIHRAIWSLNCYTVLENTQLPSSQYPGSRKCASQGCSVLLQSSSRDHHGRHLAISSFRCVISILHSSLPQIGLRLWVALSRFHFGYACPYLYRSSSPPGSYFPLTSVLRYCICGLRCFVPQKASSCQYTRITKMVEAEHWH